LTGFSVCEINEGKSGDSGKPDHQWSQSSEAAWHSWQCPPPGQVVWTPEVSVMSLFLSVVWLHGLNELWGHMNSYFAFKYSALLTYAIWEKKI